MRTVFDIFFRIVSTILGLMLMVSGGIWMLQGLRIAFPSSYMFGDIYWTFYGAPLVLIGLGQVIWSNTRPD